MLLLEFAGSVLLRRLVSGFIPWAQVAVQEEIDVRKGPAAKAEAPEPSSTASTASPAPSVEEIPPAPAPVEAPAAEARRKAVSSLHWSFVLVCSLVMP